MRLIKLFFLAYFSFTSGIYAQWSDVNLGVNGAVNALYVDSASDLLFVGGQFDTAGGKNINNIATWDGTNWNQFGNNEKFSSPGLISAIVNFNGEIIAGGKFDSIGSVLVNNIAKWNGVSWEPIGNGFNNNVTDLIVYKNKLYDFTTTGVCANIGIDVSGSTTGNVYNNMINNDIK